MLYVAQTALELGFQYALVAMALFLSYRVLDIADLTTDGCFVLGCAVSVTLTAAGHPFLAIPAAMLAGACAGFVTAFLQTKLGVPSILAGIVTNTGLYTVNLMAMGWKANQSLLKQDTIFTLFRATGIGGDWNPILLSGGITVLAGVLLVAFLGTRLGLSIRATGDNAAMVRASSINPAFTITVGLCISGALTALSGGLLAQYQGSATIDMGRGAIVIGLAAVIIGEVLLDKVFRNFALKLLSAVIGAIIYYVVITVVLRLGLESTDLKLLTALVVAVFLAVPYWKGRYFTKPVRKEGAPHA